MRRLLVPITVAAGAVGVGLLLIALAHSGEGPQPPTVREESGRPAVRVDLRPRTHRFGEPVQATLELVVPTKDIQTDTLRAGGNFDPYQVVGQPRRQFRQAGDLTIARYTITIRCLKDACLPDEGVKEFEFPTAGFTWRIPPPPGRLFRDRRLDERRAGASWPTLAVVKTVSADDVREARWRSTLRRLPEASTSVAPRRLEAGLIAAAAALVAAAAVFVGVWAHRELGRRRTAGGGVVEAPPEPLEQAIRLVETVNGDGDGQRRRLALETLAAELRRAHEPGLADAADRLAWAEEPPRREAVAALAASVRDRADGRSG